jgi:soluble lytic murein transglycosylase-like protein
MDCVVLKIPNTTLFIINVHFMALSLPYLLTPLALCLARLLLNGALIAGLCCALTGQAAVWTYVDAQGVTQFTNTEPPKGATVVIGSEVQLVQAEAVLDTSAHAAQAQRTVAVLQVNTVYKQVHSNLSDASSAYGVDLNLIKAVAASESAFNPNAVSRKGAVGLMQIMPATARQYGVMAEPGSTVARKLTNPELNIHTGTKYLSYLLRLYGGQIDLALAAYNAGEGAVLRAGNRIPEYKETQDYVRKVLAVYKVLQTQPV